MGVRLSKSRYTRGVQCPKMLWMDLHMREKFDDSVMNQAVLETGSMVGDLAMGYYGPYVEVPYDRADYARMISYTQELLEAQTPVICEATFSYDGNLCMVDILLVEDDGVRIVEVKSSTHINDIYYHDMAFQAWVLGMCGMRVKSVSLMHINNQYVRQGELDLQQLFVVEDCSDEVFAMADDVGVAVKSLTECATLEAEPSIAIGAQCKKPYECGYRGWCWRHVPAPSVFDLGGIRFDKAMRLYEDGVASLEDVGKQKLSLTSR